MQLYQLLLPAGTAQIYNHQNFARCFPKQIFQSGRIDIPILDREPGSVSRRTIELNTVLCHEFDQRDVEARISQDWMPSQGALIQDYCLNNFKEVLLEEMLNKHAHEKLKSFIVRKSPEFLVKDLTMQTINDLSVQYMKNFGGNSIYATEFIISKYQKYFVLADSEAFKYFMLEPQINRRVDKLVYEALTKAEFVEMSPDKWVIGKYEVPTYMTEINAYMRSTGDNNA